MGKVPNTPENEVKCNCPNCPTWLANECPKEKKENLFCAKGTTTCNLPDNGCVCGMCLVHDKYDLEGGYFCFNGEAQ